MFFIDDLIRLSQIKQELAFNNLGLIFLAIIYLDVPNRKYKIYMPKIN